MIFIKKLQKNEGWIWFFFIPLLVALSLVFAYLFLVGIIFDTFILLLISSWLVSKYNLQYHFLIAFSLLLPFTLELPVNSNLNVNVPTEPMLAIIIFSILWDILRKPGYIKQFFGYENKFVLPLLVCFIITSLFSTIFWVSAKFSIVNLTYIIVFYIWQKNYLKFYPNLFPKLISLFSLSFLVILFYGLYRFSQYNWYPVTIRGVFQPFYKDHTIFGATSAMLAAFWFSYSQYRKSYVFKMICLILGIFFLSGVILSYCRAAILSLVFYLIICLFLWVRLRFWHLLICMCVGFILIGVFNNSLSNILYHDKYLSHDPKFGYVEHVESSGNISSEVSNIERLNRWVSGLQMFVVKPLTGFGPGTYQFAYIPYQKPELMNRLSVHDPWNIPENSGGSAHSEYILALSEMGIFGILAILILFIRWSWIVFSKKTFLPHRKEIIIAFAVLSTYFFHALFNNFLNSDKFAFLFWGFAAWMVASYEIKKYNGNRLLL